jgi:ketopantoate reductase
MKVLVVGAGVVGTVYGAHLADEHQVEHPYRHEEAILPGTYRSLPANQQVSHLRAVLAPPTPALGALTLKGAAAATSAAGPPGR